MDTIKPLDISLLAVAGAKVMACIFALSIHPGCLGFGGQFSLRVSHRILVHCLRVRGCSPKGPSACACSRPCARTWGPGVINVRYCVRVGLNRSCGFSRKGIWSGRKLVSFSSALFLKARLDVSGLPQPVVDIRYKPEDCQAWQIVQIMIKLRLRNIEMPTIPKEL